MPIKMKKKIVSFISTVAFKHEKLIQAIRALDRKMRNPFSNIFILIIIR